MTNILARRVSTISCCQMFGIKYSQRESSTQNQTQYKSDKSTLYDFALLDIKGLPKAQSSAGKRLYAKMIFFWHGTMLLVCVLDHVIMEGLSVYCPNSWLDNKSPMLEC